MGGVVEKGLGFLIDPVGAVAGAVLGSAGSAGSVAKTLLDPLGSVLDSAGPVGSVAKAFLNPIGFFAGLFGGGPSEEELRYARQVVENVRNQLTQQLNVVQESGLAPLRGIVSQVTGDGVWKGDAANAFTDEVSNIMIPNVGTVGTQIQTFNTNIQRVGQLIDQADATNLSSVNGWGDDAAVVY